jgi:hypothetical protein
MSFHREKHSIVVTAGAGTEPSTLPLRGHLWQIFIKPTVATTNWTLELQNGRREEIGGWDDITGGMNSAYGLELPMDRTLWFVFSNVNDGAETPALVDEVFELRIMVKEDRYV